ncbi:MAG: DUF134 domain-containing protein [Christensenellaceae bacterium]|nr:DUF134 domain-containing protein [Christensenellaceae bacterium]
MPRPKKRRRVCCMPRNTQFVPVGKNFVSDEAVTMTVDEYEAIRLIDHEGLTQEQCAEYMKIARTTVQYIYNEARKKLSISIVEGKPLLISGGEYKLCNEEIYCGRGRCHRHRNKHSEIEKGDI